MSKVLKSRWKSIALCLGLGLALITLDQLTKYLARSYFSSSLKAVVVIPNFLSLTLVENPGAAFGFGDGAIVVFVAVALVISALSLAFIWYSNKMSWIYFFSGTLFIAGGFGNLIDRVLKMTVTDMIQITLFDFPVFNLADICVCLASFLCILAAFLSDDSMSIQSRDHISHEGR